MLERIKSRYFIKLLFLFIEEKSKLEIVKKRRTLQKKIGIELRHYKIYSWKYRIYEKDSKITEYYDDNSLALEGFYSIGKIFGNVKEYHKEEKIKFDEI